MTPSQRWLLAGAWVRLAVIAIGLRCRGFQTVAGWVPAQTREAREGDLAYAVRYADIVAWAARRLPFQTRCLARSLALHWWLRTEGVPSDLRIGVRKDGHDLAAHAWVVVGGIPVDGPSAVSPFTPLVPMTAWVGMSPEGGKSQLAATTNRARPAASVTCLQESRP
jgi:hypothetical protein